MDLVHALIGHGTPRQITWWYEALLEPEARIISVAATYPMVLHQFVGKSRPLYVIDENGRLAGRILAQDAASARR